MMRVFQWMLLGWCITGQAWISPGSIATSKCSGRGNFRNWSQHLAAVAQSLEASQASQAPTRQSKSMSVISTSVPHRSKQLLGILCGTLLGPLCVNILKAGWPTGNDQWNDFWLLPASGNHTLAKQAALTIELMGPTYVKFGQALASRPDIVPRSLSVALASLQDQMQPFASAKCVLQRELPIGEERDAILASLSDEPVAAASIGQVYFAFLTDKTKVAVKVQRPGIRQVVEQDARMFRDAAAVLERLQINGQPLIHTDLTGAVEEFMARLREELDYRIEAENLRTFASLYSHRMTTNTSIQVVVPHVYPDLCTKNVLVMEWIDGTKLVDLETEQSTKESLELIRQGIDCTLSQLLETGVLHADPHGGNLWKYRDPTGQSSTPKLAYVDFGLMARVPVQVRDGLVCAVAELVFERNVTAVASLFGELALIPDSVLNDPVEMEALGNELKLALAEVLIYPSTVSMSSSPIPQLRFDKLLNVLSRLIPRFRFQLPPYFLNNLRALSTLEGMAREIQPDFNVLQFLYPYALERILENPSESPVVETTLEHLITSHGRIDHHKIQQLLKDVLLLTGYSKKKLIGDVFKSAIGPRLARRLLRDYIVQFGRRQRTERRKPRESAVVFRL